MYGIPNMKLDKAIVQRRIQLLEEEGIMFYTDAEVGKDVDIETLKQNHEAIITCTGSNMPRDLKIPGRELKGIHFAMEFLKGNQKRLLFASDGGLQSNWQKEYISAEGKDIVIIGGGDTGTDCIATSLRHRCRSIITLEHKAQPPLTRAPSNPWPEYPRVYGIDYGHAEYRSVYGKDPRIYEKSTKEFIGDENGHIKAIVTLDTMKCKETGKLEEIPGSEKTYPCDLAILAMGFSGPSQYLSKVLSLEKDARGNILAPYGNFRTSIPGIFAAGDCRRGQSLVVWAINEGRYVAQAVEKYFIETGYIEKVCNAQAYTS